MLAGFGGGGGGGGGRVTDGTSVKLCTICTHGGFTRTKKTR